MIQEISESKAGKDQLQIAWVLIGTGGVLLTGAMCYFAISSLLSVDMVATTGIVNRIEKRRERRKDHEDPSDDRYVTVHRPIVRYQVDHVTYEVEAENMIGLAVGDEFDVLYSHDDPAAGIVDTVWNRWGLSLVFGGLGLFFLSGGVLLLSRRSSARGINE